MEIAQKVSSQCIQVMAEISVLSVFEAPAIFHIEASRESEKINLKSPARMLEK
jgi:hypothetical protein